MDDPTAAFHRLLTHQTASGRGRMAVARHRLGGRLELGVIYEAEPLSVNIHGGRVEYAHADELISDGWRLAGWH